MQKLEQKINEKRKEMIALSKKFGLQSHNVIAVSQELDILINKYSSQKGQLLR